MDANSDSSKEQLLKSLWFSKYLPKPEIEKQIRITVKEIRRLCITNRKFSFTMIETVILNELKSIKTFLKALRWKIKSKVGHATIMSYYELYNDLQFQQQEPKSEEVMNEIENIADGIFWSFRSTCKMNEIMLDDLETMKEFLDAKRMEISSKLKWKRILFTRWRCSSLKSYHRFLTEKQKKKVIEIEELVMGMNRPSKTKGNEMFYVPLHSFWNKVISQLLDKSILAPLDTERKQNWRKKQEMEKLIPTDTNAYVVDVTRSVEEGHQEEDSDECEKHRQQEAVKWPLPILVAFSAVLLTILSMIVVVNKYPKYGSFFPILKPLDYVFVIWVLGAMFITRAPFSAFLIARSLEEGHQEEDSEKHRQQDVKWTLTILVTSSAVLLIILSTIVLVNKYPNYGYVFPCLLLLGFVMLFISVVTAMVVTRAPFSASLIALLSTLAILMLIISVQSFTQLYLPISGIIFLWWSMLMENQSPNE